MPNQQPKLKVAVIGGGNMGKNHLRNYFLMPEVELVGLADVNPKTKTLANEYKTDFFTDYVEMLDTLKPDAVSIVVPTTLHAKIAADVMERGIHCLLEKPISTTVEEAQQLIKLSKKKKLVFTIGHIEHYNPLVVSLKKLLEDEAIGHITSVVSKRVGGFPEREPRTDVVLDLAIHDIGIISYLLNEKPLSVSSHGSRTHHSSQIDSAELLIDYGKASGFIQANWLTPVKIRTIAITGTKGYIEGNYITQELSIYKHTFSKSFVEGDFDNVVFEMKAQEKEVILVEFEEPLYKELFAFVSHIIGDKSSMLVSPVEATNALKIALEATDGFNKKKEKI